MPDESSRRKGEQSKEKARERERERERERTVDWQGGKEKGIHCPFGDGTRLVSLYLFKEDIADT